MGVAIFLICFPLIVAPIMYLIRNDKVRGRVTYVCGALITAAALCLTVRWCAGGMQVIKAYNPAEWIDHLILAGEIVLAVIVTILCFKYHRGIISLLAIVPTGMITYLELKGPALAEVNAIYVDHLSILMCLIVGIIGVLIVVYAVGYMEGYHEHHTEFVNRKNYFFMVLFLFLGAMFGFVLSSSLLWIDLFWEITSVCSFLLIGYTKTDEAITNSFRALWMNLLGGTALAVGIVYLAYRGGNVSLQYLISLGTAGRVIAIIPIALIAVAALTKAAQLPFSTWLMGAMVAPTPSSALLHSATMVKAGIYMLFRLAPAMPGTTTGMMVSLVGGFTFFMASIMAISQRDAKKVLALSTISNLGLMVACAGVGRPETIWAGIFLMLFHAVSKSLLFQDVGATENATGSRNIEDMHGLMYRLPRLAIFMFVGIAGMYLAPFGMLISKWSALKAAVDNNNIILVLFIAFGSATTGFYWTKWMGKLIAFSHRSGQKESDHMFPEEVLSLTVHAVLMIALCVLLPLISKAYVDPLLVEMFGPYTDVLSTSILIMLVVTICFVFAIPMLSMVYTRNLKMNMKLSYMSGINAGNNKRFIDAMGDKKKIWLVNYYFEDFIQADRMMRYSQIFAAAVLIIMICVVIGGVL